MIDILATLAEEDGGRIHLLSDLTWQFDGPVAEDVQAAFRAYNMAADMGPPVYDWRVCVNTMARLTGATVESMVQFQDPDPGPGVVY